MDATRWSRGLEVTAGGTGVVSHAGLVLLPELAGLSAALPSPQGGHDRGRVFADLASAIADGAQMISDFRVMGDQRELFGPVASVPTAWRVLKEAAFGGGQARRKVTAAVNRARRHAWAQAGPLPPVRIADWQLTGVACIRLDATASGPIPVRSCPCSRRPAAGATRRGPRTSPLIREAGAASAPTSTPRTASTPASRTFRTGKNTSLGHFLP